MPAVFVAGPPAPALPTVAGPRAILRRLGAAWVTSLALTAPAGAAEGLPGLSMIEAKDLRLIFLSPSLDFLTPHVIRSFTNSLLWQRERFGWTPTEPVTVFLKDFTDYGNAGASPMPLNAVNVEVEPLPNAFETDPSSERMVTTMNHELVHVANGDVANSTDRFWRRVFLGKVAAQPSNPESLLYSYLTVPRFNVPRWLLEGSAVFMETWMGGGVGRAQGGYDEMVYRAMVRDQAEFYDPLGLESRGVRVDFQVGVNAYLYGTRFITWLALVHSPEKVIAWLRRDEGSSRYYADAFEQTFGLSLDAAWQRWIAFEHDFQQRNLAEIRKAPITPLKRLVPQGLGSSSRTFLDAQRGVLYGAYRRPGTVEYLGALDIRTGSMRRLVDLRGGVLYSVTSLAFDPERRTLFYTTNNLSMRDLVAFDLETGEETVLQKQARIGELVFDAASRSLVGVRHDDAVATLVRMPYPYTTWETLHRFPYGVIPTDLDISPDGRRLSASVKEVNGDQYLRVWSLDALKEGRLEQVAQFEFGQAAPEGFVFSPDGRFLYGSSYYTGVSNIFRCEPATGATEAVTNAETGVFRPLPLADGRLVVQEYTGQGFVPSTLTPVPLQDVGAIRFLGNEVARQHPVVTTWQVPPPDTVDAEKLIIRRGPYAPEKELQLLNAFPVVQGYKETAGVGYRLNYGDPLGYAGVGLTAAWTPDRALQSSERAHVELTGRYLGWSGSLSWNRSDFYDLFGPTKRSRKGFAARVDYALPLIYDRPRWLEVRASLAHYRGIDTLPTAQNVPSGVTELTTAQGGIFYTHLRKSLGAVDEEQGIASSAVAIANAAPGVSTQQGRATVDVGLALPWDHASIWSRTAIGSASGDRQSTLAPFYFGAFGNNRIDNGEIRRYRNFDSMPGFAINQIAGLSFVRETLEFTLPPIVFRSLGKPDLHLTWLRSALFATVLETDPERASGRGRWASIGTQVDLRFSVFHWYEMVLSAGYGAGFQGRRHVGNEWMISLKIM